MIASIAIPALMALFFKVVLLGYSLRSPMKNATTRLFFALLVVLALYNLAEVIGLDQFVAHGVTPSSQVYGFAYLALLVPSISLVLHISLRLSFDLPADDPRVKAQWLLHLPGFILVYLLLFTDRLVLGFQPFMNTALRIPGPSYFWFEAYSVAYVLAALSILIYGARATRSSLVRRKRNQWWLLAITPMALLLIYLIPANHFGTAKLTSTIYLPIALTFFLVVTAYATHQHRLFDIAFVIPWSKTRAHKAAMYARIQAAIAEIQKLPCVDKSAAALVSRALHCSATLILDGVDTAGVEVQDDAKAAQFPRETLEGIDQLLVASEIEEIMPELHQVMKQYSVAAIVPLLAYANTRGWMLLGKSFSDEIHSRQDFQQVDPLFRTLEQRMQTIEECLERILGRFERAERAVRAADAGVSNAGASSPEHSPAGRSPSVLRDLAPGESLDDLLDAQERRLIREALERTGGNVSAAARLLQVRPNTLYYKMRRHSISADTTDDAKTNR